jgi:hypothetical protein
MFRVIQSQTRPQNFNSSLGHRSAEDRLVRKKSKQVSTSLVTPSGVANSLRRRRRSRRLAGASAANLRSTWF